MSYRALTGHWLTEYCASPDQRSSRSSYGRQPGGYGDRTAGTSGSSGLTDRVDDCGKRSSNCACTRGGCFYSGNRSMTPSEHSGSTIDGCSSCYVRRSDFVAVTPWILTPSGWGKGGTCLRQVHWKNYASNAMTASSSDRCSVACLAQPSGNTRSAYSRSAEKTWHIAQSWRISRAYKGPAAN